MQTEQRHNHEQVERILRPLRLRLLSSTSSLPSRLLLRLHFRGPLAPFAFQLQSASEGQVGRRAAHSTRRSWQHLTDRAGSPQKAVPSYHCLHTYTHTHTHTHTHTRTHTRTYTHMYTHTEDRHKRVRGGISIRTAAEGEPCSDTSTASRSHGVFVVCV